MGNEGKLSDTFGGMNLRGLQNLEGVGRRGYEVTPYGSDKSTLYVFFVICAIVPGVEVVKFLC